MVNTVMTKYEHYIPQICLRGFSPDDTNIYEYRISDGFQPPCAVKIESICYKKYLYEVRNENDGFISPNQVENCFCQIEGAFSNYRKQLMNKAFIESNYQSTQFLTVKEKDFWKYYIAIQMLRVPRVLEIAETVTQNEFHSYRLRMVGLLHTISCGKRRYGAGMSQSFYLTLLQCTDIMNAIRRARRTART